MNDAPSLLIMIPAIIGVVALVLVVIWRRRTARSKRAPKRASAAEVSRGAPIPDSSLVTAGELGTGGQGRVHELANDPTRVKKVLLQPLPSAVSEFAHLIALGADINSSLAGLPIHLSWPERATGSDQAVTGYVMKKIPGEFYFVPVNGDPKPRLRDFQLIEPSRWTPFTISDADRVELVRLVANFLAVMHARGLVYGDISWTNFAFTLEPEVSLSVYDFDSTRELGMEPVTRERPKETVDWDDPSRAEPPLVATLDGDRHKFALLAYRVLVSRDRGSEIDPSRMINNSALDANQAAWLTALWRRSAGSPGTRPAIGEWLAALSLPIGRNPAVSYR